MAEQGRESLRGPLLAEFLGTRVLITRGNGVVARVVLVGQGVPGRVVHAGHTSVTVGWGVAVTMGVFVAGRVSRAHLTPAVAVALAVLRDFPCRKVGPYCLAQLVGAFAGAARVYVHYLPAF